eukprot:15796550-Heterocapsa_arctica.AAC.1
MARSEFERPMGVLIRRTEPRSDGPWPTARTDVQPLLATEGMESGRLHAGDVRQQWSGGDMED